MEYILRRVPQEGHEGEPVDRIREAFYNKYTGAYMHSFCIHTKVADKSCRQKFHRVYQA